MSRPADDPIAAARAEIAATGVGRSDRETPAPGADAPPGEQPGDVIGRYRLERCLGQGGMGTVWLAEQREPVRRQVALKVIKLGMDTREVLARFEAERQALALMDHPHIARVFDGGASDSGRPYFVMERVEGAPITRYCDERRLGLDARLTLFVQVCAALQHAHQKGVIHRDIKPGNVLVTEQDGRAVPKVIDFGVAKATGGERGPRTAVTRHAQLIGTPECMAPEQAESGGLDVDTRADVYSLGVLLYELLTGVRPFARDGSGSTSDVELLRTIRESDPTRPSTRLATVEDGGAVAARRGLDPARLRERLRGDLDWIVLKALEKDRDRRYESATALADDVRRSLRDEPVAAVPPSTVYRLRKLLRRRRAAVVAGLVVSLLFVAGAVGTGVGWWRAEQANRDKDAALTAQAEALRREEAQRRLAQQHAERATRAEAQATARAAALERVAGFHAEQLNDLDPEWIGVRFRQGLLDAVAPADRRILDGLLADVDLTGLAVDWMDEHLFQRTLDAIDVQFADQPLVAAQLLHGLAETLGDVGLDERAVAPLEQAQALRRDALGADHVDSLRSRAAVGRALYFAGRLDEAEPLLLASADALATALGDDHAEALKATNDLARLRTAQDRFAEAEALHRQVLARAREVLGADHKLAFDALHDLGSALAQGGRLGEAEEVLREALDEARRLFGEDDTLTLVALSNLGMQFELAGRFAEAQACHEQAHAGTRRQLGDQHPLTSGMLYGVARNLAHQGRHGEALEQGQQVWSLRRATYGDAHPKTLDVVHDMGAWLIRLGELDQAVALYEQLLRQRGQVLGEDHPDTLMTANNTAVALSHQGDQARARDLFARVVDGWQSERGDGDPNTLAAIHNLGRTEHALGRLAEAEPHYRTAVARRLALSGPRDVDYLIALADLGLVLKDQQRLDEAWPPLSDAVAALRKHHWPDDDPRMQDLLGELSEVLVGLDRAEEVEGLLAGAALD